jgi:hypothetical protein
VARLMSHAVLLETLDSGAIWAVARGLARNVQRYKIRRCLPTAIARGAMTWTAEAR